MDNSLIADAQYRKGLSIAFFNATNNAIQLVENENDLDLTLPDASRIERIVFWRDWLLEEHNKYYSNVISKIGIKIDSKSVIERAKATQDVEELKKLWTSLTEDERRNPEIKKVINEMKKQHETIR